MIDEDLSDLFGFRIGRRISGGIIREIEQEADLRACRFANRFIEAFQVQPGIREHPIGPELRSVDRLEEEPVIPPVPVGKDQPFTFVEEHRSGDRECVRESAGGDRHRNRSSEIGILFVYHPSPSLPKLLDSSGRRIGECFLGKPIVEQVAHASERVGPLPVVERYADGGIVSFSFRLLRLFHDSFGREVELFPSAGEHGQDSAAAG